MSGIGITTSIFRWRVFALDFFGQRHAHRETRAVDRHAVHHRIGAREIHVFEDAGIEHGLVAALAAVQLALVVDEHRFARRHVAQQAETQGIDRHAFRRHDVFVRRGLLVDADHQRADAVRVAEGQQAVAGDKGGHRIRALATRVHAGDRAENRIQAQLPPFGAHLQLMRQHVQQHLGIRIGVDVTQVGAEQRFLAVRGCW